MQKRLKYSSGSYKFKETCFRIYVSFCLSLTIVPFHLVSAQKNMASCLIHGLKVHSTASIIYL
jgi:hypothetical protein